MIKVEPYQFPYKFLDWLLSPAMRLISGAPFEAPQEVHNWNMQDIDNGKKNEIKQELSVSVSGTYSGYLGKEHGGILFHFPILGGWKEYIVFETSFRGTWYLGWIVEGMKRPYFQVCKLALHDARVRALKPAKGVSVLFFAINELGEQIPLVQTGEGTIGDKKFGHIRLL